MKRMKLGLVSYTNRTSGCGIIASELLRWLPVDSILSAYSTKGQSRWLKRQLSCRMPSGMTPLRYLRVYRPSVVLGIETFFSRGLMQRCHQRRVKMALIVMHESYHSGMPISLFICPTRAAYDRVEESRKVYFPLPFDLSMFQFKQRTEAKKFLHVVGYGVLRNRRQTREVIGGFLEANIPGATLTVHCQRNWAEAYGHCDDPRVTYRWLTYPEPYEIYSGFDVLIQPDAYAGLNRLLYEASACGLPIITTNAPPMNECDWATMVPVAKTEHLEPQTGRDFSVVGRTFNTMRYFVRSDAVAEAIRVAAGPGVKERSLAARRGAETRGWTPEKAAEFKFLLGRLL